MLHRLIRDDYRRHGRSLTNPAFVSLCVYRLGRWGLDRRTKVGRVVVSRLYGALNLVVANITKIWIPPQVRIGEDFHIIHAEGSLSIHPDAVIGDRLGVMHNVTIGTNMRPGAPVIGNDVFIGVNSTVLGAITIGDRVRIASNTAVTRNVPSDSIVVGSPAKIYRRLAPFQSPEAPAAPAAVAVSASRPNERPLAAAAARYAGEEKRAGASPAGANQRATPHLRGAEA